MFCVGCFFNLSMDEIPLEAYLCCVSYVSRPMTHSWLPTLPLNIQTSFTQLPVGFPDVDGLRVHDVVLLSLLIQQVEKVFDS